MSQWVYHYLNELYKAWTISVCKLLVPISYVWSCDALHVLQAGHVKVFMAFLKLVLFPDHADKYPLDAISFSLPVFQSTHNVDFSPLSSAWHFPAVVVGHLDTWQPRVFGLVSSICAFENFTFLICTGIERKYVICEARRSKLLIYISFDCNRRFAPFFNLIFAPQFLYCTDHFDPSVI